MKTSRKAKQNVIIGLTLLIVLAAAMGMTACSSSTMEIQAADLMDGISSKTVSGRLSDDQFIDNTADFSFELFKNTITAKENSLISPLSALLALAMTANGADNQTFAQMEEVLGRGISLDELNEYLYSYVKSLPSENKSKLSIANSIWFRDDENRLMVEKDFLQKNADYYNAAAYKSTFDEQTVKDINEWVKVNTQGMIENILDQIDDDAVMYLINAVAFEAEWETVYNKNEIFSGDFIAIDGSTQTVDFMFSEENSYIDDGKAVGFIKPYANGNYSFVTLLPNEDVAIEDYIETLSGEGFINTIKHAENTPVAATLPKFQYDYTIKMNDTLKVLGMPDAFSDSKADFNKLGRSTRGNIYIGEVLHKTFISVDELGTKAGAVTKVEMKDESYMETKNVKLDRPFVYIIIDNSTKLPIFMGTVMSLQD